MIQETKLAQQCFNKRPPVGRRCAQRKGFVSLNDTVLHIWRSGSLSGSVAFVIRTTMAVTCMYVLMVGSVGGQADDGYPFGPKNDGDFTRLYEFAKGRNFDLDGVVHRMYRDNDVDALADIFRFAVVFKTLDSNARTFGHLLYNTFLNLGEQIGPEEYARVLGQQPANVQQRVRNFLYYPILRAPKHERKTIDGQMRIAYPALFPGTFVFGRHDPMFEDPD